jgi:hypothetical protein
MITVSQQEGGIADHDHSHHDHHDHHVLVIMTTT